MASEEGLSAASIIASLETHFVGQRIIYYSTLLSTMDEAKKEARRGAPEGTTVIAGEQTAGRGRIKRAWLSPKGSLALSIILYPSIMHLPSLIMLASLAVVRSIEAATGLKSQIKWPNDILISGKKICGILIENEVRGNNIDYAIIGIGVNVNLRTADFPEIIPIATSLSDELGRDVSLLDVLQRLLVEIERLYLILLTGGSLYEEWRDSLVILGREVRVKSGETVYEGIAESVARDGSLLLRCFDGSLAKIVAGDATLRA